MQFLDSYNSYIEKQISDIPFPKQPVNLYEPLRYFMQLGGKRIRPVLTLLGTELFDGKKEDALSAALAVEVFHNFTLIHDDIMDEAPTRRNQPTVHTKWDQNIAILSGDVLFVKAFQLLSNQKINHLPDILQLFNQTAIEVCEGQQLDIDFEKRRDVGLDEYIEMIRLKTSVLLGCALEMGAVIADASAEHRQLIYDFGQHIGIAFQIQDDILDLYADPEKFGKQVGGDVISNKKTILSIKAKELALGEQLDTLEELQNETNLELKVRTTRSIFDTIGVRQYAEDMMQSHYDKAMSSLEAIKVEDQKKDHLIQLAKYLMQREV